MNIKEFKYVLMFIISLLMLTSCS
ncbi:uncharacterized protein METZ01_LOCUS399793, partial [marine metagenome]